MRHSAHGDAYAHNVQEVIQLLIQEAGCEPQDCFYIEIKNNPSSRGKPFQASIIEHSTGEYVLHVEADSKEEVEAILKEAKIEIGEND